MDGNSLISTYGGSSAGTVDLSTIPTSYWVGFAIVIVLGIVGMWKIFEKAGEAGWKAIIPIYNTYIFCKIIKINFWILVLLVPLVLGFISGLVPALSILSELYVLGLSTWMMIRLGKSFGKSTGFIVGLVLLTIIFELILAFDDSKYQG